MSMNLYIVVDVSGSMNEMGKIHLQRNLCRYINQLQLLNRQKYAHLDIHFYQWRESLSELVKENDGDIPLLKAEGSADLIPLAGFLSEKLSNAKKLVVMILSDGYFSRSDISSFHKKLSSFPQLVIQVVAVGADANHFILKEITTNKRLYLAENIATAIDHAIFGCHESLLPPNSTSDISEQTPVLVEEAWDA